MTGHVWLVGAGPGDPELLTLAARRLLEAADVVLHDALIAPQSLAACGPECEVIAVGKRAGRHSATQDEINTLIVEHASRGRRVVRLKGGDPFTFGRGGEEALACRDAGIPFTVVPGVSSALAAPAYAGIPVTHRGAASMVTFITAQEAEAGPAVDWEAAARAQTLVVLMGAGRVAEVASRLTSAGASPQTPAACIESATYPGQRVIRAPLGELGEAAARADLAAPAIIVVGESVALAGQLAWFAPGPLAGKRVAVTRPAGEEDALASNLRALGAIVTDAPIVAIAARGGDASTWLSTKCDWIAFTSANAVRCFFEALAAARKDARALGATQIAAIGPATAGVLWHYGVRADFLPQSASGAALGTELPDVAGTRVLLPVSTLAGTSLEETLRARGAEVERVEIYETLPATLAPSLLEQVRCADAVTLASPSAARALAAALDGAAPAGKLVSIGPGTSTEVRSLFGRVDAEARERTAAGLAEAVAEVLTWDS